MRRVVLLAAAGGLVAVSAPAFAASSESAATLPGCAVVGKASCKFTILKSNSVPAGVVATTTWKIVGAGHTYTGGRGKTTIVFQAGTYTLSTLATGFAGAGKIQP